MRKGLVIILDGLGDLPSEALGKRTPLEAASTPVMDTLASRGRCAMVDPLAPGVRVGTHVGAGVVMGLDPEGAQGLGRGPVEAAGVDMPLQPGDVAFRCNLATLREEGGQLYVVDRRAGRINEGGDALCSLFEGEPLGEGVIATLRPATQHRVVLRLSGEGLSADVSNSDPGDAAPLPAPVSPCHATQPGSPAALKTSRAVERVLRMAFDRFADHPVNRARVARGEAPATGIITRGAGQIVPLRNVIRRRGLSAAVVSAECTVLGLGRLFDFELVTEPGFTAGIDTDLDAKVSAACAALARHPLVFLHIKGTDVCAHDREPGLKRDFLERIDAALTPLLDLDAVIAITADHSTDSNTGSHTSDPVPSVLCGTAVAADACERYSETDCRSGGLGRLRSSEFLTHVLDAMQGNRAGLDICSAVEDASE